MANWCLIVMSLKHNLSHLTLATPVMEDWCDCSWPLTFLFSIVSPGPSCQWPLTFLFSVISPVTCQWPLTFPFSVFSRPVTCQWPLTFLFSVFSPPVTCQWRYCSTLFLVCLDWIGSKVNIILHSFLKNGGV